MIDLFGHQGPISDVPIPIGLAETTREEPKPIFFPKEWLSVSAAYQYVHGLKGRPSTDQYKPWLERILDTENILVLSKSGHKNRCPWLYMEDVKRLKRKHDEMKINRQLPLGTKQITEKNYYTVKEVSDLLNISQGVVYKEINSGRLKSVRFANCIRISNEDLNSYLKGE